MSKHRLNPRSYIMVEDQLRNLKIAKKLGMKTVWISKSAKMPAYVDVHLRDVMQLPQHLDSLVGAR